MTQPITSPSARDQVRAGRTAFKLTGMSQDQVMGLMRDSARQIAKLLVANEIPIPSKRHRPDVGPVQIDMIVIQERITRPEPAMQLAFDIEGDMGVTLKIKLLELLEDPAGYTRNLLQQFGPMRRNMMRRRRDVRARNERLYRALTEGATHG